MTHVVADRTDIQADRAVAAALDALEVVPINAYAIEGIVRTVLYEIQDKVHGIAEAADAPDPAELRALATRLTSCAAALEAMA